MVETSVKKRNLVSIVLGLLFAAALILMPAAKVSAEDHPEVQYVDVTVGENDVLSTNANASVAKYTVVSDQTFNQEWTSGWYVVNSTIETDNYFIVAGDVKLILCDGCELSTTHITVSGDGNSLTIYGQANGTGKLTIDVGSRGYWAGIGGIGSEACGNITINGGIVTATGGEHGAGIGGGESGNGSNITINGGEVTARGGANGAGIGGGYYGTGSNIKIRGGKVTATGGSTGAGIGGGQSGAGSNITISGGEVTATGGSAGAGIGGGQGGAGSNITISGGEVTAKSESHGAGIGGGNGQDGSNIVISGGKVTANGGKYGAGIGGGGNEGAGNNITISGGEVTATGGESGAGIGGGSKGAGSNITISGGTVTATGGNSGAGIGGGDIGDGSDITISGGTVIATGGNGGAEIGGGAHRNSERISINGGTVISLSPSVVIAANKAGSRALLGTLTIAPSATYSVNVYSNSGCTDEVTGFSFDKDEESGEFFVSLDSPIECGRYYYKFTYSDNDSNSVTKTGQISSAIELTKDDFTVENDNCVYSGNVQYPTVTCKYSTAIVDYYYFDAKTHKQVDLLVSAGTYDIYAGIIARSMFIGNSVYFSDSYESGGVCLGTFIIEKSTPKAPATLTGVRTSKGGVSDGKITGTTTAMEYSTTTDFAESVACDDREVTGLKAGTYYVRIKKTANTNASSFTKVIVPDGDKEIFTDITIMGYSGDYDGEAHGVSVAGVPEGATVKYGTVEGTYDSDSVTFTDFTNGVKTVFVKVSKENYNDWIDNATVTINRKDISGATVGNFASMTYTGSAQVPSANVTIGGLDVTGSWSSVTNVADTTTFTADGNFIGTISGKVTGMAKSTPAAPAGLADVKTSEFGKSDGKITGTTAAMEYSKTEDFTSAIDCADTEVTGLAAGTYYVRIKGTANTNASACVEVTVAEGDKKTFEGITVTGFSGVYDGKAHGITISGVPEGATVKYGTVEGSCDSDSITFTDFTNGAKTVYVKVSKENYNDWTDNATVTIAKSTPAVPDGLAGVKPSEFGKSDGKITGTTDAMEYSKTENFASAIDCAGTEVAGLAAGTYYVRIKETANTNASASIAVVVDEGDKKADPTPIPTPIPTPAPEPVIIIIPRLSAKDTNAS